MSDVFFAVPRGVLPAFSAAVGSHVGMSHNSDGQCGCFDAHCPSRVGLVNGVRRPHLLTGHDCFNVLAAALGAPALGFVWPPIRESVREANPHYELPQCADIDAGTPHAMRACNAGGCARHPRRSAPPQTTRAAESTAALGAPPWPRRMRKQKMKLGMMKPGMGRFSAEGGKGRLGKAAASRRTRERRRLHASRAQRRGAPLGGDAARRMGAGLGPP